MLCIIINDEVYTLFSYLKKADGELRMVLGRDPNAEIGVDGRALRDGVHDLATEGQRQVAVLQQQPISGEHAVLQQLPRRYLLALAHRDRPQRWRDSVVTN